ncbi:RICIN domain-containing protein [Micromonospora sp. NPDC050276]|uniref:RICIN domain-containing protein n=1 Tax=Micromonospora sp. NPDC050276 TaxID=3364278 RepID=UPI0037927AFD
MLSGKREVTIVRVQATEGGIALDGELTEVDDDSGRQLFVPTPLGGDTYLIKAYGKADNHPANDEPACWQVTNPGNTQPLTVEGAVCDTANPAQRFTITPSGKNTYAISNRSAYLQHSPTKGMILEEVADGPVRSTFRFVDNGPARRPAGG